MNDHPLDNLIWHALERFHRDFATGDELARRYRPEFAPFMAIPEVNRESEAALARLVNSGERVAILNVAPTFSSDWQVDKKIQLLQFVWDRPAPAFDKANIRELTAADVPAMLELTALVYPAYFRAGTSELGQYVGIFDGDRLCSMAGIRMSLPGFREISAICTDPDYRGRGLASQLTKHLIDVILAEGNQPFLHTESYNEAGRAMYAGMGFSMRAELPFWILTRQ